MKLDSKQTYNSYVPANIKQQQGAALIVVLMVVLLLAIAGAIAVRSSQTSLNMTTAAQVNQLLMQSSDVPLAHLENSNVTQFDASQSQLEAMNDENGPIGYLRINGKLKDFDGAEYVLCYQPTARKGLYAGKDEHSAVTLNEDGTTYGRRKKSTGFCQLDDSNAYTSARGVVATQVSMTRPTLDDKLLEGTDVGTESNTDASGNTVDKKVQLHTKNTFAGIKGSDPSTYGVSNDIKIRTYSTSILPSMAISSKIDDINDCLSKPVGGLAQDSEDNNQRLCLSQTDTPHNIQVQEFMYIDDPEVETTGN